MSASIPAPGRRTAYTEGLRRLADWLDLHPEIPLPYHGQGSEFGLPMAIYYTADTEARAHMAEAAKVFPNPLTKNADGALFTLTGMIAGLYVDLIAWRDQVCERTVIDTREVTETIPDPDAPKVTVTHTEEVIEWVCSPLLDRDADR